MDDVRRRTSRRARLPLLLSWAIGLALAGACAEISEPEVSSLVVLGGGARMAQPTSVAPVVTASRTPPAAVPTTPNTAATAAAATELPNSTTSLEPAATSIAATPELELVGVGYSAHLNLRDAPGTRGEVLLAITPGTSSLAPTGNEERVGSSRWLELEVGGITGWASSSFLGYLGRTEDRTAEVLLAAGGSLSAPTLTELAEVTGDLVGSTGNTRARITQAPVDGIVGTVGVDVLALDELPVMGARLQISAAGFAGGWQLRAVTSTVICRYGVNGDEQPAPCRDRSLP